MFDHRRLGRHGRSALGPGARRYRRRRRADRRDRRAGQPCRNRRRPHRRRFGADRHSGRHRPACPLPVADAAARPHRPPADRSGRAWSAVRRSIGGTTTTIDFALVEAGESVQQAIERRQRQWAGACYGDYAFHTMVQGKIAPETLGSAGRGGAGRPSLGQDLHDRHHPLAQGPHGRFRRHLGGVEGAGEGGRHRRDPRRGQRHRHAHVREAVPRGPHRLREHGRSPQHACPRICRSTG